MRHVIDRARILFSELQKFLSTMFNKKKSEKELNYLNSAHSSDFSSVIVPIVTAAWELSCLL